MCLALSFMAQKVILGYQEESNETSAENNSDFIFILLLCEHIFAYITVTVRKWEIDLYGKPNVLGMYTAPIETILGNIHMIVDCILFGWIIKHLL